ncbi:hypothetical protein M501DRAFT_995781 [Patellaria atrata CBS 101060]|uniref:Extracellular membrane protein CFEM domain-containing protein n=1 Tax=Patellaria atrata CBS 101060 TaxID=1346257 RepID=A0A9P4S7H2_9PEZI|nr:hypothetical protein M501DRAFT_995781 [Patellaria atrata CBS 101060]
MRAQLAVAAAAVLYTSSATADLPSCAFQCLTSIDISGYNWRNGWEGLCTDQTAVATANSCIEDSDCSEEDKSGLYQIIAQACANAGATITAAPQATFAVTSGGSAWPSSWSDGDWGPGNWGPWGSHDASWTTKYSSGWGPWDHSSWAGSWNSHTGSWSSKSGWGPWGHDNWGPWGSSHSDWASGPWTAWWGGGDCPDTTWSGWTDGPWSTAPPWVSWEGCTATITESSVYTTTVSGTEVTGTTLGIGVAQATALPTTTTGSETLEPGVFGTETTNAPSTVPTDAAADRTVALGGIFGAALLAAGWAL